MTKKQKTLVIIGSVVGVILLLLLALLLFINAKLDLIEYANEIDKGAYDSVTLGDSLDVDIGGLEQVDGLTLADGEIWGDDNVMNILVLGTDERTRDFSTNARSDAMILVSINKKDNSVKLVSLERAMGVPILDGQYAGNSDILTHIFRYGGADLVVRTVREVLKVDVQYYVRVNFTAVKEIVDTIGGIDVNLTAAEAEALNQHLDSNKTTDHQQRLVEGANHIDGGVALAYSRLRSIDSDWQRVGRQRKVMLAAVNTLKGVSLVQLNNLANTVLPMVQTNLSKTQLAELLLYSPEFFSASFAQRTIPETGTFGGAVGLNGQAMYAPDYAVNSEILREFLYGETK